MVMKSGSARACPARGGGRARRPPAGGRAGPGLALLLEPLEPLALALELELPDLPDLPELLDLPGLPELPELPELPALPALLRPSGAAGASVPGCSLTAGGLDR